MISLFVSKEKAKERYEICKNCENFSLKFCTKCRCFMPAKVTFYATSCPLKKWSSEKVDPTITDKYEVSD